MKQLLSQSTNVPTSATPPDHVCQCVWESGSSIKEVRQRSLYWTEMLYDCFFSLCTVPAVQYDHRLAFRFLRVLSLDHTELIGRKNCFFQRHMLYSLDINFILVQPWLNFMVLMQLLWNLFWGDCYWKYEFVILFAYHWRGNYFNKKYNTNTTCVCHITKLNKEKYHSHLRRYTGSYDPFSNTEHLVPKCWWARH